MINFKQNTLLSILIILFIVNIPTSSKALDLMFYNMTVSDGLSQTTIKTIFQDSNGYIWIGTTDGLNKYNGFEFDIYNKGLQNDKKIISGHIYCINEDSNKNLFIGTSEGLSILNLDTNKITNYTTDNSNLPSNKIRDIKVTNDGRIILATSKGLVLYDKLKHNFSDLSNENYKYSLDNIISIEVYNDEIYAISPNYFFRYNTLTNEYNIIDNNTINNLSKTDTFTNFSIYKDKVYLGTHSKGLFLYNILTNEIDKNYTLPVSDNDTTSNAVNYIFNDSDNLWIGTDKGVYFYDSYGSLNKFTNNYTDKYSLANNNVQYITKDSSGLMWIGTYSGLSTVDCDAGTSYYNIFSSNSNINANIVLGIYEDYDDKLYIGYYGDGLNIVDNNFNKENFISTKTQNKLSNDNIWNVVGNEKYIFMATEKGVNILDKNTFEITTICDELTNPYVNSLFVDGYNLWVGTKGGFDIINLNDFTVSSINSLLRSYNISIGLGGAIYKDSQGLYWLGSTNKDGLIRFDSTNNTIKLFKCSNSDNSISDDTIISIAEDSDGNMWFGTENGLNKYNRTTEEFKHYSMNDGLSNNTIYSITPYKDDILISTNKGLNFINLNNDDVVGVKTYFPGVEFNSNSVFKLKNGKIAFGAIDGLYMLDTNTLKNNTYIPELKFDSFEVNGIEMNNLDNVNIDYRTNSISVKLFTTLYSYTENVKFYYKIDNMDTEWQLMHDNEVTFSNLASGEYNVNFKAENSNGTSSSIKSIYFKVEPPFWQSTYAKLLISLAIFIIMIYFYVRIKYMNFTILLKNNQLSTEMKTKNELLTKNIELERRKNNYLINMSHELRTPLNVIYSVHQLILDYNKNAPLTQKQLNKYMDMSHNNIKRLLKLINDLIDSTKIDEGSYKLFFEEKDIVYVVEEAALSLKNLIEEKGISLIVDTDIEEFIMKFDENAIERCIVNIVGNAYKFTEEGGEITINIIDLYSVIRIDITDTGSGLSKENIETIFDRFNQVVNSKRELSDGSGLGLTITKRLVKLHNGHIFVKSELGKGSTFTIVLPKNN